MANIRDKLGVGGLLFLFGGVGIGLILIFSGDSDDFNDQPDGTNTNFEADLVATGVEYDQLNPDGSLNYKLIADSIIQYPEQEGESDDHTDLVEPKFQLNNSDEPPWNTDARKGKLARAADPQKPGEEVLHLNDNVIMRQIHPERGDLRISSESFSIYPHREYAQTDEAVIIDSEFGRTEAAGMRANLTTGVLTLVSSEGPVSEGSQNEGGNTGKKRVHTVVMPENFKNSEQNGNDEGSSS